MTPRDSDSRRLPFAAKVLFATLFWGGAWAWAAIWYASGLQTGQHPRHYDLIPWWGWVAWAAAPLVVGSLIVTIQGARS